MTVWIAQCLCPQRHAILAASGEAETAAQAREILDHLRERIAEMIGKRILNPWCGICRAGAEDWRYEIGRTRWATMAEARPHLEANEAEQRATAALIGDGDPGKGEHFP